MLHYEPSRASLGQHQGEQGARDGPELSGYVAVVGSRLKLVG